MNKIFGKRLYQAKKKGAPFLLSAVTLLWGASSRLSADEVNANCYRAWFTERPHWVTSALARQKEPPLILVDPVQNKLLAYDRNGNLAYLGTPKIADKLGFLPTAVDQANGDNFLLELADGTLVQFNHDLSAAKIVLSPQTKRANSLRIGSLYQWKLAGDSLVAYGVLLDEKDNLHLGFFRVPLGGKEQTPEMLTSLPERGSEFYLLGNSYITTIGETAYYIVMGGRPTIIRAVPGRKSEALRSFPDGFRTTPMFSTEITGPKNAAAHFAELENFSVASGLYSQDGFLYLLTRSPGYRGTEWYLYKINPIEDRILSPAIRLPTSANHITVAPSKTAWFFIEKGPVQAMQQQKINSMVVIDNSAVLSLKKLPASCPTTTESLGRERLAKNFSMRDLSVVVAMLILGIVIIAMMVRRGVSYIKRE